MTDFPPFAMNAIPSGMHEADADAVRYEMSKIKTPQQKKRQSYEHDRRNTYGENQKSSRKNIPRSKQRSHQDERRSVRQVLVVAQGGILEEAADEAQSQALRKGRIKKLKAFRKSPDRPLGEVVERRLRRRTREPAADADI